MLSKIPADAGVSEANVSATAAIGPADTRKIMLPLRAAITGPCLVDRASPCEAAHLNVRAGGKLQHLVNPGAIRAAFTPAPKTPK
jgi:hypothetical protein